MDRRCHRSSFTSSASAHVRWSALLSRARKWKIISTRTGRGAGGRLSTSAGDAALIDLASPDEDTWKAAAFAAEFPALLSLR